MCWCGDGGGWRGGCGKDVVVFCGVCECGGVGVCWWM